MIKNLLLQGNKVSLVGTLKGQVFELIKSAILNGSLPPGQIFSQDQLSELFGVSRTPVREAILELQKSGLVIVHRGKGIEVVPLTKEDVLEIMEMRQALEGIACELAVEKMDNKTVGVLKSILSEQEEAAGAGDKERFLEKDGLLHRIIAESTCNSRLYSAIEDLRDQFIRIGNYAILNGNRMNEVLAEHKLLIEAIVNRKPDNARQAIIAHLRKTLAEVLESLEEN